MSVLAVTVLWRLVTTFVICKKSFVATTVSSILNMNYFLYARNFFDLYVHACPVNILYSDDGLEFVQIVWIACFFMAALRNRCGHYIFALWFLSSSIFFLSWPNLSHPRLDVYHFHTWCGLGANLGCRSETCCTRLAENTGRKKSPSGHHRATLSGYIFATKARIDNRKKLVKQPYVLHMSPQ